VRLDAKLRFKAKLSPAYCLTGEDRDFSASYVPLSACQQIEDDVDLALNSQ
jgi:hypothetical protein